MRLRGIRSRRRPSRGGASRGVGRAAGASRRLPGSGRGRRYAGLKSQAQAYGARGTAGPRGSRRVRGRRRMKKRGCP